MIGSERKDGIFVVRSDATRVSSQVLKAGARKHELLVTNAVAVSFLMTLIPFPFVEVWFGINVVIKFVNFEERKGKKFKKRT